MRCAYTIIDQITASPPAAPPPNLPPVFLHFSILFLQFDVLFVFCLSPFSKFAEDLDGINELDQVLMDKLQKCRSWRIESKLLLCSHFGLNLSSTRCFEIVQICNPWRSKQKKQGHLPSHHTIVGFVSGQALTYAQSPKKIVCLATMKIGCTIIPTEDPF